MMLALCIGSVWCVCVCVGSHDVGLVYRECDVRCGVGGTHDVGLVYRECGVGWWLT